jgi:hypothetical protein
MFYGFARYHLRHGVPWHHDAARGGYRRVTVTLRSVPRPTPTAAPVAKRRRKDGEDAKQRRLMEMWLDSLGSSWGHGNYWWFNGGLMVV